MLARGICQYHIPDCMREGNTRNNEGNYLSGLEGVRVIFGKDKVSSGPYPVLSIRVLLREEDDLCYIY